MADIGETVSGMLPQGSSIGLMILIGTLMICGVLVLVGIGLIIVFEQVQASKPVKITKMNVT